MHLELSIAQAAEMLNVSRHYVLELFEDGEIGSTGCGWERRARLDDLVAWLHDSLRAAAGLSTTSNVDTGPALASEGRPSTSTRSRRVRPPALQTRAVAPTRRRVPQRAASTPTLRPVRPVRSLRHDRSNRFLTMQRLSSPDRCWRDAAKDWLHGELKRTLERLTNVRPPSEPCLKAA